jgi:hypothetical protein
VQPCIIYFFFFILLNKSYVYVNFYFKLILINKFVKHNQVNYPYCDIKYLDLLLSLIFFQFCFCLRKKLWSQTGFVGVSFFSLFFLYWTWLFFPFIFSHIVKQIVSKKSHLLNFIKSMDMFTSLVGWPRS